VTGYPSVGTGGLGLLANVVWFLLAGWWLIALHVVAACACAVTVIGIPFAWAHMKIAAAAMAPVGKVVVPGEVAAEIERERQGNRSRTSACTLQNSVEVIGVPSSDLAADLEALTGFG